jgi:hypothetical protein
MALLLDTATSFVSAHVTPDLSLPPNAIEMYASDTQKHLRVTNDPILQKKQQDHLLCIPPAHQFERL